MLAWRKRPMRGDATWQALINPALTRHSEPAAFAQEILEAPFRHAAACKVVQSVRHVPGRVIHAPPDIMRR
jgi:hypothetical protein